MNHKSVYNWVLSNAEKMAKNIQMVVSPGEKNSPPINAGTWSPLLRTWFFCDPLAQWNFQGSDSVAARPKPSLASNECRCQQQKAWGKIDVDIVVVAWWLYRGLYYVYMFMFIYFYLQHVDLRIYIYIYYIWKKLKLTYITTLLTLMVIRIHEMRFFCFG